MSGIQDLFNDKKMEAEGNPRLSVKGMTNGMRYKKLLNYLSISNS